jgi:DNA-binding NtrC family response regulator
VSIKLPPLRERSDDISLLANHFLNEFGKSMIRPVNRISAEALECLERYRWPGNVRELQNVIERALSMCEGDLITASDLPEHISIADARTAADPASLPLKEARRFWLDPLEKEYLEKLLQKHNGNISEAARAAEIDRQTIYRMLKKHGIRNAIDQG